MRRRSIRAPGCLITSAHFAVSAFNVLRDSSGLGTALRVAKLAWAAPCTLAGLVGLALAVCVGATVRRVGPTLEVALSGRRPARSGRLRRWPFAAVTLGHVIIGTSAVELDRLRAHERVHVEQYERWGPLFFVAYVASSLSQLLRGRDPYADNRFEVEARRRSVANAPTIGAARRYAVDDTPHEPAR